MPRKIIDNWQITLGKFVAYNVSSWQKKLFSSANSVQFGKSLYL